MTLQQQDEVAAAPYLDLFAPALHDDPYAWYARAREAAPLCRGPHGLAVVTRHRDVSAALRDPRLGHGTTAGPDRIFSFLGLDPPGHGPLRAVAARFFAPRAIAALGPAIAGLADELLDAALDKGEVDLLSDLAYPLSLRVIGRLFALPEADQPWIRAQTPPIGRLLDPPYSISGPDLAAAEAAAAVFVRYLSAQARDRRRRPGDDLLSALIAGSDAGALARRDLIPMFALLVLAGYETTANVIANAALALLSQPGATATARAGARDGQLAPAAMDELIRYDSSIQVTFRTVQRDAVVAGAALPAGTRVALLIGSANHDPRVFARPGRLDLQRSPNPHLSFGAGIHYCLGAPLARLEASLALGRLLARAGHAELATARPRHKDITAAIRGLEELPVRLAPC
jgi:cytochrome P450